MLVHRTRYRFLSNYTHTVFLEIDEEREKLLFSAPIPHSTKVDVSDKTDPKISVRLALLHLTFKCLESDYRLLNSEVANRLREDWISNRWTKGSVLATPYASERAPKNPELERGHGLESKMNRLTIGRGQQDSPSKRKTHRQGNDELSSKMRDALDEELAQVRQRMTRSKVRKMQDANFEGSEPDGGEGDNEQ
jgi:hypothetical protein